MSSPPAWAPAAKWVWIPNFNEAERDALATFVLFRKKFLWTAKTSGKECAVHVSADSRYRLFVNGVSVSFGPCKSYPARWYCETVDVAPYLVDGMNVISARVLRYSHKITGSLSIMGTYLPGFMVHSDIDVGPLLF
jgi:hypothetical protein